MNRNDYRILSNAIRALAGVCDGAVREDGMVKSIIKKMLGEEEYSKREAALEKSREFARMNANR